MSPKKFTSLEDEVEYLRKRYEAAMKVVEAARDLISCGAVEYNRDAGCPLRDALDDLEQA